MESSIPKLRDIYRALTEAVDESEKAFEPAAKAALFHDRCPTREVLTRILLVTHRICSNLAKFIEGIEDAFRLEPNAIQQLLDELEPPKSEEDLEVGPPPEDWYDVDDGVPRELQDAHWETLQRIHPCRVKGDSAIARIPGIYGISTAISNHLYEKEVTESHIWRETHDLWVRFTYHGGITASGGLANRLQDLNQTFRQRSEKEPTRESPFRRIVRCFKLHRAEPELGSEPWREKDLQELRRLAERARWLAEANEDELSEDAMEKWCFIMDEWLKGLEDGKDLAAAETVLIGLVDEAPSAPRDEIAGRLRRLHQHFNSADLRAAIDARLRGISGPGA